MTFVRPYTMSGSGDGSYCVVRDALGRIVAQGSRAMCDQVMAGTVSTVQLQGVLF